METEETGPEETGHDDLPYFTVIDKALRESDIEGLIAGGAPADEYEGEAEMIAAAIGALPPADFTHENVVEIITYIWADSFDLDEEAMARRQDALEKLAAIVL